MAMASMLPPKWFLAIEGMGLLYPAIGTFASRVEKISLRESFKELRKGANSIRF